VTVGIKWSSGRRVEAGFVALLVDVDGNLAKAVRPRVGELAGGAYVAVEHVGHADAAGARQPGRLRWRRGFSRPYPAYCTGTWLISLSEEKQGTDIESSKAI
jgi:hypothetical protein